MKYLGGRLNGRPYSEYIISEDRGSLQNYPSPVNVEGIPVEIIEKLLPILNQDKEVTELTSGGKSSRSIINIIKETDEVKIVTGASGNCVSNYEIFYGGVNEILERENPAFKGIDGRTEGWFKHKILSPKENIAILIKTSYGMGRIERDVYFLRK